MPDAVRISAPSTPVAKFVWPAGWLGLIGYLNVLAFTGSPSLRWGGGVEPVWGKPLLVALFGLGLYVAYRVSLPLKRVGLVEGGLHVSNYFRETTIPWSDVRRVVVHGTFGNRRAPVVELELRRRGAFGTRVSLIPASREALQLLQDTCAAHASGAWEHRPA